MNGSLMESILIYPMVPVAFIITVGLVTISLIALFKRGD